MSEMHCENARELMLEAEMTELEGRGDTALARHIAGCELCQAYARRLLDGYAQLDAGLSALAPRAALRTRRSPRAWTRWVPLPLAAAAVLALMLTRSSDTLVPQSDLMLALMFPEQPLVTPAPGKQAMIL
jgi:hypothetical protein